MKKASKEKLINCLRTNVKLWNRYRRLMKNRTVDLRGAYLRCAQLQNANLQYTNLRNANLQNADLRGADLRDTKLQNAKLKNANLQGADLDYSSGIPLWCGGQDFEIDEKQAMQILAHALAGVCDSEEYNAIREFARKFCEKSHIQKHINWLGGKS